MRLAWLLLTRSGRSNWGRLGLTAAAVALGILMLLVFAAGLNGLNSRAAFSSWRFDTFISGNNQQPIEGIAPLKADVATGGNLNKWHNENITVLSLRATGGTSPQVPGLPTPKDGEYYVSRGLEKVMREHPEVSIGSRYGDKQIGVIPDNLSASPDALEVMRGMSAEEAKGEFVVSVYKFTSSGETVSKYSGLIGVLLAVGGTILLLPIIVFISIATQLDSAQREKRYAAMRLVGATRRQVSRIMAVESLVAAVAGVAVGSLAYLALLPLMSQYEFDSMRFYQSDITVPLVQYVLIVALTLIFCLFANWWGMRHVQLSPLGVARTSKLGKRPRMWRLILLAPGLAMFAWMSTPSGMAWLHENSYGDNANLVLMLLVLGVMSIMFGLLLAGPWLTSSISRLVARRTSSVTTLLAGKRIETQSNRVFRSVSGVVLALFAGSFYLTSVSGLAEYSANAVSNNGYSQLKDDTALVTSEVLPATFIGTLRQQPYVKEVVPADTLAGAVTVVSCSHANTYIRNVCPDDTAYLGINFNEGVSSQKWYGQTPDDISEQIIKDNNADPASARRSEPGFLVKLDTNDNLDQLRTLVAKEAGIDTAAWVVSGTYAQIPVINPIILELASLAYAGMAVTLFVAVVSLIVSTIGGLLERKRSFATLRLGGMTVAQMKRTVMIESLIPLIGVSLLACGIGIWVGMVFISALSDSVKPTITSLYLAIVVGSLVIATLAIRSVVPMLDKLTRPEANQTE